MAATGPLADFARLPAQRKVLVFAVVGLLLGGLYYQFIFKGLNKDVDAAETEHNGKVQQSARMTAQIPEYEKLKTKFTELQRIVGENQKALPTTAELPSFFETLNRKVKDSGVEITNWTQAGEEPVDQFVKVPVRMEITGTFLQIKRFFASLVQKQDDTSTDKRDRERIVSIESLTLGDAKLKNRELILTAKFTAATYRQDETKVPVAAQVTGNVAPAPSTAVPPMPSAATPEGAKQRVNAAMQKDVERTEKGIGSALGSASGSATGSARLKDGK